MNPRQAANRFAHRPELKDIGWLFYFQRHRIAHRLDRAIKRVARKKARLARSGD